MDNHDKILRSAPLKQAALQMAKGETFSVLHKLNCAEWDNPPDLKPMPLRDPTFVNLTGRQFGRFTVIGYLASGIASGKGNGRSRWLVQCRCGRYSQRDVRAIKNPNNAGDRCTSCRDTAKKRNEDLHTGTYFSRGVR